MKHNKLTPARYPTQANVNAKYQMTQQSMAVGIQAGACSCWKQMEWKRKRLELQSEFELFRIEHSSLYVRGTESYSSKFSF